MHRFKRFFLLASLVLSFAIPFIEIGVAADVPVLSQQTTFMEEYVYGSQNIIEENDVVAIDAVHQPVVISKKALSIESVAVSLYLLICLLLFIRFCINIFKLMDIIKKNKTLSYNKARLVLLEDKCVAHSFLAYIFISKADFENRNIREEILLHELTHVKQKHSIDIIFIELLNIALWFNPIIYFYKNKIKLNHEFLADETVISNCGVAHYQSILLDEISKNNKLSLTSNFNYLITKRRLIMMTKISSKKTKMFKIAGLLPLLAAIVFVFSTVAKADVKQQLQSENKMDDIVDSIVCSEIDGEKSIYSFERGGEGVSIERFNLFKKLKEKYNKERHDLKKMTPEDARNYVDIYNKMSFDQRDELDMCVITGLIYSSVGSGIGASQAQIEEYKSILEKYESANGKYEDIGLRITDADRDRLKFISETMDTVEQNAVKIVIGRHIPAVSKEVPYVSELKSWKNSEKYKVRIDGNWVDNEELDNYKNADFSYVKLSRYGKKFENANNQEKKVQVDLVTNKVFEEYLEKKKTEKPIIYYKEGAKLIEIG